MKFRTTVALLLMGVSAMPAYAQNRFMDQAKEAADRRAEHKAVREAENPEPVKPEPVKKGTATAQAAPAATPAAPAAPAETPVAPAAPAAPATAQ